MYEKKIKVSSEREGKLGLEPLNVVVEYCLKHGMSLGPNLDDKYFTLVHKKKKEEKHCYLQGHITVSDLLEIFIFPKHFMFEKGQMYGEIWDCKHHTKIFFHKRDVEAENLANIRRWTDHF